MSLHVRTGEVSVLRAQAPTGTEWLSPSERARLAGLGAERRAAQFVAGRWLARRLLAETYGEPLMAWQLEGADGRAPVVAGHPGIHLSIAHSGGLVVCATAPVPLGVDVEATTRRKRGGLLHAITTPEELAGLGDAGEDTLTQQVWTLKEAWIKCCGAELFSTMLGHGARVSPGSRGEANACTWRLHGAVFALAVREVLPEVCCHEGEALPLRYWQVGAGDRVTTFN